jgi:hypothetical protein
MALVPNRPTPEGRALGDELARLVEPEIARLLTEHGQADLRCSSCAFRLGTAPNGCAGTLMDALKCALEGHPFFCHMGERPVCFGWVAAAVWMGAGTVKAPWPWSGDPASAV